MNKEQCYTKLGAYPNETKHFAPKIVTLGKVLSLLALLEVYILICVFLAPSTTFQNPMSTYIVETGCTKSLPSIRYASLRLHLREIKLEQGLVIAGRSKLRHNMFYGALPFLRGSMHQAM